LVNRQKAVVSLPTMGAEKSPRWVGFFLLYSEGLCPLLFFLFPLHRILARFYGGGDD
jgi:hypothetical protein